MVINGSSVGLRTPLRRSTLVLLLASMLLSLGALAACAPASPMDGMPSEIASAPTVVRTAYAFAVTHPDVLLQVPCYCGCGNIGHTSNYDCYVSGVDADGNVTYDTHALGCSICVDITQDAMRLLNEGHSVAQVRARVDSAYSSFGPSNMP